MLTERHHEILRDWHDDLRTGRVFERNYGGAGPVSDERRKLSDDAVRAIRHDPRSLSEIAQAYGISPNYACGVRTRMLRADVPDIPEAAE